MSNLRSGVIQMMYPVMLVYLAGVMVFDASLLFDLIACGWCLIVSGEAMSAHKNQAMIDRQIKLSDDMIANARQAEATSRQMNADARRFVLYEREDSIN